jgi:hypothetical protein
MAYVASPPGLAQLSENRVDDCVNDVTFLLRTNVLDRSPVTPQTARGQERILTSEAYQVFGSKLEFAAEVRVEKIP